MPTLTRAEGPVLELILDETFPLWGDGLSRTDYERFNRAQTLTPWGSAHLERVADAPERPSFVHHVAWLGAELETCGGEVVVTDWGIASMRDAQGAQAEAVMGTRGEASRCMCQWFKIRDKDWKSVPVEELAGRLAAMLRSRAHLCPSRFFGGSWCVSSTGLWAWPFRACCGWPPSTARW